MSQYWEEEDWFPEETKKPVKQVRAILDPKYSFAVAQVISKLDPASFVRLARTCKAMNTFCFHSKDITVSFNDLHVYIEAREDKYRMRVANLKGGIVKFLDSATNRRLIRQKYPFVFNFKNISVMRPLDEGLISIVRSFLKELPVKKITEVLTDLPIDWLPWNGYLQILKDFQVETVDIYRFDGGYDTFPEDMASQLLISNLKKFCCDFNIPEELIFEATVPHLELRGNRISLETFGALVLKCAESSDDIFWVFGCQQFEFNHHDVYKTISFDHRGPIPNDRPLIVLGEKKKNKEGEIIEEYTHHFWILRRDGKVVHCFDDGDFFEFSTFDNSLPKCLRSKDHPVSSNALVFVPEQRVVPPEWKQRVAFGNQYW